MNILLIGNGFDIAHGLPTTYNDFLSFIRLIKGINDAQNSIELYGFKEKNYVNNFCNLIQKNFVQNIGGKKERVLNIIQTNFWINYFLDIENLKKEKWVDFENEISYVIKILEGLILNAASGRIHVENKNIDSCLFKYCKDIIDNENLDSEYNQYKTEFLPSVLKKHLDDLIELLEIYLLDYVEPLTNKYYISPDIKEMYINKIISFNYTHTYSLIYDEVKIKKIYYIHGEIGQNDPTNIVLGINEYHSDDKKNTNLDFIEFKKYYQRIFKGTGITYKEWLEEIEIRNEKYIKIYETEKNNNRKIRLEKIRLYIFGHSLDISDKDILKALILHKYVNTTIYYHDQKSLHEKIVNLIKIIGQDNLLERTENGRIKFVQQAGMTNNLNIK